jgi:hypothetical protein
MLPTDIQQPSICAICGHYLTTSDIFVGQRCLDPGHWQATGLLHPTDFYLLARIAARAGMEQRQRLLTQLHR